MADEPKRQETLPHVTAPAFFEQSDRLRWKLRVILGLALLSQCVGRPVRAETMMLAQATPVPPDRLRSTETLPLPPKPLPPKPPTLLPPPDQLFQLPTPNAPNPQTPASDAPETITVERFRVTGSTVFSAADFDQVTAPFTKRPISLAELFQARSAVTQLYLDRGYITTGAFLPPQKLQSGVVEIQVVEGGLEDIKVTGTQRLKPNYVRSRLAIATGKPLNRNRLLEALQLLQLNPLIKTLSAELSAGTRPGESILEVKVTEAKTFNAQFKLDNGRSPSVGTDRRQIQLGEANLLGFGDSLSVSYTNTNGSNTVDATYTAPINAQNGTISFSFSNSSSTVVERPFDILDIQSRSRYYELTLRQPLMQTPAQEFAVGLTLNHQDNKVTLLGDEIPFPSLGADSQGRTQVTALRFFQEWTQRSSREVIALRSQFSVGLNVLNATINDTAPDGRFFAWRGQAQWVRLLAPETLLLVRGDAQFADRSLLALEQFSIGGIDSIRGYRQDFLLTDNGLFGSAEVRVPIAHIPQWSGLLQVAPFVEVGTGWNRSGRPDPDPKTLASLGLGLRLQVSNYLTARFDWGIPLVSISGRGGSLQEQGLYFSVIYSPF